MKKRIFAGLLALCMTVSMFTGCAGQKQETEKNVQTAAPTQANVEPVKEEAAVTPKYVFLFIGDGMSYPQFQAASDYLGAIADNDYEKALPSTKYDTREGAVLDGPVKLSFMDFEVAGSAVTYDEPEPVQQEQEEPQAAPPSADDSSIWDFGSGSGSSDNSDDDMSGDFGGFGGF